MAVIPATVKISRSPSKIVMVATPRVFVLAEHNKHQILRTGRQIHPHFERRRYGELTKGHSPNFQKILSFWKRPFVDRDAPKSRRPPLQRASPVLTCTTPLLRHK